MLLLLALWMAGCVRPEKIQGAHPIKDVDAESEQPVFIMGTGFERNEPMFFDTALYGGFALVTGPVGRNQEFRVDLSKNHDAEIVKSLQDTLCSFFLKFDIRTDILDDTAGFEIGLSESGLITGIRFRVGDDSVHIESLVRGQAGPAARISVGDFDKSWSSWMVRVDGNSILLDENVQQRRFLDSPCTGPAYGPAAWDVLTIRGRGLNSRFSLDNIGIYE